MVTIYAIRCNVDGKRYIGCTVCKMSKRWREHRCRLRAGEHKCKPLQSAWLEHGADAFSLETLETFLWDFSVESKRTAELFWLRYFEARGLLYNEHIISFRPSDAAIKLGIEASRTSVGNRWTEATNLKRRLAQLGKPKGHGAKISATKRKRRDSLLCKEKELAEARDKEPAR